MNLTAVAIVGLMITLFVGMGFCVAAYRSFDRLLRVEYMNYRRQWELDGGPIGFFWVPPGGKTLSGGLARSELVSTWGSARPSWVEGDDEASEAYAGFKRLSRFTNRVTLAFIGGFALMWVVIIVFLTR